MTVLLTARQMRDAEQAAFASGAATGAELMERAGEGVVSALLNSWGELAVVPSRAIILCGPGNNGGDGFVIARLLARRGWAVRVFLLGQADGLPPDARLNHDRWCTMGDVRRLPFDTPPQPEGPSGVVVDALFGTGLTRGLGPEVAGVLESLEAQGFEGWYRVAVDLPSGLCADSGRRITAEDGTTAAFRADLTVSFHAAKLGHYLDEGAEFCGALAVADIGLSPEATPELVRLVQAPALPLGKRGGHKFDHGHALVLSGGFGRTGAARLAARAALRVGAGLVTLGVPGAAQMEVAAQITALMMRRIEAADDLAQMLEDRRLNALCLGPGLGADRARELVPAALAAGRATVLDADALSAFSDAPDALFSALHPGCVLTPHGGEFARLFPDLSARLSGPARRGPAVSRVDMVRAAAARAGCTVLLKGPDTVIAAPDGDAAVHAAVYERATPWLATAGAGDVLAGLICGLMARGVDPWRAAQTATFLHVEAARHHGPGLIAEDLPEALPAVLRGLGA
ncbi:NAD(P)H-hydrate dehydratase [Alloyangia pacifica]|uniref:Bifunctional NAD(P)H-hydrate repair enzyme n=1 Tax=Alloyangia pacifica TaxID=311180 RepID=A0A1I6WL39_9RHOB|nr:NAD(P)H-hydrate dehydratase [Alloyangia pacifica]SDI91263.1 yjeF C-terminal region, hydroxyethylthiazole kinase-related/yjeF N-terminal region [Alloyangia pacifica]SFT26699.1 yjeF C-terminal region, hydroxyethylthiazole kinase-related/yjeF N-terminal region [Alloyangia pacifica]